MSSEIRIRAGELYPKDDVMSVLGRDFLASLVKQFDLLRCGTNNKAFYVGDDIIEAMKRHARHEQGKEEAIS